MKLIPKAKPVRIRITSGNQEHNTLESLRKNFVWEDVKELFDGRLDKWLRRIDACNIADQLLALDHPDQNLLQTYNILFRAEKPLNSKKDVFAAFISDKSLHALVDSIIAEMPVNELMENAQEFSDISSIFITPIAKLAESYDENTLGEQSFSVGKFLFEREQYVDIAKKCIEFASKKGLREAKDFKKQFLITDRENDSEFLDTISLNIDFVKKVISDSWKKLELIQINDSSDLKYLYYFSNKCLKFYKEAKILSNSNEIAIRARSYFGFVTPHNLLYQETVFVHMLFETDINYINRQLKKIETYPPARAILRNRRFEVFTSTKAHIFRPCKIFSNLDHLPFFVTNLYRFETND